jgi:hypothetical protein
MVVRRASPARLSRDRAAVAAGPLRLSGWTKEIWWSEWVSG